MIRIEDRSSEIKVNSWLISGAFLQTIVRFYSDKPNKYKEKLRSKLIDNISHFRSFL